MEPGAAAKASRNLAAAARKSGSTMALLMRRYSIGASSFSGAVCSTFALRRLRERSISSSIRA